MTFTDDTEMKAGRIFLDAWKRRIKERGQMLFFAPDELREALIKEQRAFRLAEAVWKEGAAECS